MEVKTGVYIIGVVLISLVVFVNSNSQFHWLSLHEVKEIKGVNEAIHCFNGLKPTIYEIWATAEIEVEIDDDFSIFYGNNEREVEEKFRKARELWLLKWKPLNMKNFEIDPFTTTCVGVQSDSPFSLLVRFYQINYLKALMACVGLVGFLSAKKVARNVYFHYGASVSFGVLFSFFILVYLLQRRLRLSWTSGIVGTLFVYCIKASMSRENINIEKYSHLVLYYLVTTVVISLGITYRFGPVSNPKTLNLIQWALQGVNLMLIFFSSYYQFLSISICAMIIIYNICR